MVRFAAGLLNRLGSSIREDIGRLSDHVQAIRRADDIGPGLYSYRIQDAGYQLRLHLRIHPDRTGLLFVNATEAIQLSPTQAEMAKMTLDTIPRQQALARLRVYYPKVAAAELAQQFGRICTMLEKLKAPTEGCRLCELDLPQPPPFSVRAQAPYKADLALHYACNNNCSHCYNEPGRKAMPSLPVAQWREVLKRLWDIGVPYIIFTGGEPTLHPGIVELVAHADELGQITGINTNGRRLADAGFAEALQAVGLDHVQITLNSHRSELHNRIVGAEAFDETVAGIKAALDAGLHVLTNTTLIEDNADEALEIVDFLDALGLRTFAMNGMIYSGCGARHPAALDEEQLQPVLLKVRERAAEHGMRFLWYTPTRYCRMSPVEMGLGIRCCNAAEYSVCIEPNGEVLPCQSYYAPAGNILSDPWEAVWESELFRSFRYRREDPQQAGLPEECWECELLDICGGGCALERQEKQTAETAAG